MTARRTRNRRGRRLRFTPGLVLWALLLLLAVPTLALAQTEAPPAASTSDGTPALLDDGTAAPVENYGTMPNGEEEITFEPNQSATAPSGTLETPPVTPAPPDPGTSPAPVDQTPTDPVGEDPTTPPTDPVVDDPNGVTPVDETPVVSVIDQSPEQQPSDGPVYTPPVTAFPSVDIPAADPLPTEVIPTNLASYSSGTPVPPAAEAPVPPASSPAPIVRPPQTVTRAGTIPSMLTPFRSALAPKPESQFTTGTDPFVAIAPTTPPASTPGRRDIGIPAPGLDKDALANPFQSRLESPTGSVPGGSQLFQVLAQYVMAGGSGPPTGVALLLLVQLATVIGAFAWRTPRSMSQMVLGVADKVSVGYRAVALRPG